MRVLIVDDSSMMRLMLKSLIRQAHSAEVCEAKDGLEALAQAAQYTFDVVLLDIHMPNMDGLTCLDRLRTTPHTARVPIIMCSSDADANQMKAALDRGATAYVKKPFQIEGLKSALSAALGSVMAAQ